MNSTITRLIFAANRKQNRNRRGNEYNHRHGSHLPTCSYNEQVQKKVSTKKTIKKKYTRITNPRKKIITQKYEKNKSKTVSYSRTNIQEPCKQIDLLFQRTSIT